MMRRKNPLRKTAQRPVRFGDQELAKVERAAARRSKERGEIVTATEIIREGALRLADEILQPAA